jgi:hypothetical protein
MKKPESQSRFNIPMYPRRLSGEVFGMFGINSQRRNEPGEQSLSVFGRQPEWGDLVFWDC